MNQPKVIQGLILGLPIGLIITGVIAMFLYFGEVDMEETPSIPAISRQKPVSAAQWQTYRLILTDDIGERNLANSQKLITCINFLESSMSQRNMGYEDIRRDKFSRNGIDFFNVTATQEGSDGMQGIAIVADADTKEGEPGGATSSTALASLLSIANAVVGEETKSSLLFGGLGLGASAPEAPSTAAFIQLNREQGHVISNAIVLRNLSFTAGSPKLRVQHAGIPATATLVAKIKKALPFTIIDDPNPGIHDKIFQEKNIPSVTIQAAEPVASDAIDPETSARIVTALGELVRNLANQSL